MLSTLVNAGRVLDQFTVERPEWGVTELAAALGMSKSNAHALLATLSEIGLLKRTDQGRYHLGWRLLTLNHVLLHSTAFRAEARPVMSRLVERFGETTHLGVLQDGQVMYVDKLQGTQAVRVMTDMGVRLPAHCSGVGKALLSGLSEAEVEAIAASKGLPAFTPGTITTLEELKSELARVRRRGYAYDIEEVIPELCCVAAPIRDGAGTVVAALSISAPFYRFRAKKREYREAVLAAVEEISRRLAETRGELVG